MSSVFDSRVFSGETHQSSEPDGQAEEREARERAEREEKEQAEARRAAMGSR